MRHTLIGVIAALCLSAPGRAQTTPMVGPKIWNQMYTQLAKEGEPFQPNPFLARIVTGMKPGKALDFGMGQGRNALMLAERGWDVTGFDISDLAIEQAKAQALKRRLTLNAMVADSEAFEYGIEQYDLVAAIYVHGLLTDAADKVIRSMKHGGTLVVEGAHHETAPMYGYETNELLKVFGERMTVLYYEDARAQQPDKTWTLVGKDLNRFVRLVARKE